MDDPGCSQVGAGLCNLHNTALYRKKNGLVTHHPIFSHNTAEYRTFFSQLLPNIKLTGFIFWSKFQGPQGGLFIFVSLFLADVCFQVSQIS